MSTTAETSQRRLSRKAAGITALVAALAFAVLAAVLVPWDWVPGGELTPARATGVFTAEQIERAEAYSAARRYLGWGSYAVSLVVACLLGFTRLGATVVRRIGSRLRWWIVVVLGVLAVLLLGRLATLPFSVAIHQLGLNYGLSNQDWGSWTLDVAKSFVVSAVLMSVVVLLVVGTARLSPRYWFAWGSAAAAGVTVAASYLYPVVVEPLFNEFTSMQPGPFKASVLQLADDEGVEVDDVLVADASRRTTTLNAYVSGFGSTRRVVIYDNLLSDLRPAEARVIIAHELAHAKHGDVVVGTALGAVGGVVGICLLALMLDSRRLGRRAGFDGAGDPRAVATILALVALGTLLASPVQNTISRAIEARADRDSIAATGDGEVFTDMQTALAIHSLNDPTPPRLSQFWFGSHPTVLQRVGLPASLEEAAR